MCIRDRTQGDFEEIEPLRARLVEPLERLSGALQAAQDDVQAQLTALWGLLQDLSLIHI